MARSDQEQLWKELLRKSFPPSEWYEEDEVDCSEGKSRWLYRRYHARWQVGYYTPSGDWVLDHDYETREEAATRVHYLNGHK